MKNGRNIPEIAILVGTANSWGRGLIKGILSYANQVGPWHIWIQEVSTPKLEHIPDDWQGDGIIARVTTPEFAAELNASGLPVINVADSAIPGYEVPCVRTDDRAGARLAIGHFADRGIRHLGFVGPDFLPNPVWYAKTFFEEAETRGLSFDQFRITEDNEPYLERLSDWLQKAPKPIGVFAWGHGHARNVVDCCLRAKISVPHDVAILAGNYDELLSHACFPTLSGILSPVEEIGHTAAKKLHSLLKGESVPAETEFIAPKEIAARLSTDTLAIKNHRLIEVIEYIRANALSPISMTDILNEVPMARRSLERQFQQVIGHSPVEEIRRIRVDKARQLLAETDLSMREIADACGYASYNYLTHFFKKRTGVTPGAYRKRCHSLDL